MTDANIEISNVIFFLRETTQTTRGRPWKTLLYIDLQETITTFKKKTNRDTRRH